MANSSGQGTLLTGGTSGGVDLKFGTTEAYQIIRISRLLDKSVNVINNSHLGIAAGEPERVCPGDLVTYAPIVVDVIQDFENTSRYPDADSGSETPIPLGTETGTTTTDWFIYTLKGGTATTNFATLKHSGFIARDSGIELVTNRTDPPTAQFTIRVDGESDIVWNGVGAA